MTGHRAFVGDEGAQPGPSVLDPADRKVEGALDAIDADRDIELFRLRIAGRRRRLVGGRDQQLSGIGLEVEFLLGIHHHRPRLGHVRYHPLRRRHQHRRSPLGYEADFLHPCQVRHLVGPGAGRVDDDAAAKGSGRGLHPPSTAIAGDANHLAIGGQFSALRAERLEIMLMQSVDIDIGCGIVQQRLGEIVRTQQGHHGCGALVRKWLDRGAELLAFGCQRSSLVVARHEDHAARLQQGVRDELALRIEKEGMRRTRKGADHGRPVGDSEQGGGTAGSVIAGTRLALEQQDPGLPRQPGRDRRSGHARSDHDDIEILPHRHPCSQRK